MRRLIFQMMVSIDGFFEGSNQELDWHLVDGEFNVYAADLLDNVDLLIFGRRTYQGMADYWPTPAAIENDPVIAQRMNSIAKLVFSTTLKKAGWNNARLSKGNVVEEITRLKREPGKDIAIFGSSDLALSLIPARLIDEFRIFVNPVVLGDGKTLFKGIKDRISLKLLRTRVFRSGLVLLCYKQAG